VTVRDRDTLLQERLPADAVASFIRERVHP
jgi:glycyl-tRNA synthetase (class II)